MRSKPGDWWQERWWRVWMLMVAFMVGGFLTVGAPGVFAVWGVKATEPTFADARGVTAGWESRADGHDPLVNNPCDPWQRPFNYPRIWLVPGLFGWDQTQTTAIGHALIIGFFLGWLVFPPGSTGWTGIMGMLAVGLSPANILGMERGNIDLLMFALLALAIRAAAGGTVGGGYVAFMAILTGFVLKLYPLAGAAVFLCAGKRRFFISAGLLAVLAASYLAFTWEDLRMISQSTPRATGLSYGRNVLWMELQTHGALLGQAGQVASWLGVAAAVGLFVRGWRSISEEPEHRGEAGLARAGFFAGAAVYCGTFMIGNNWDYRLVFLLFCMPWLAGVGQAKGKDRWDQWASRLAVVCILLSCWHLTLFQIFGGLPGGGPACVLLDETANWILFLALSWLAGKNLPDWAKGTTDTSNP